MIYIESRRKQRVTLEARYPEATFVDVTSRGEQPWVRFSPFFPHGGIPIPFSPGNTGQSVEGIWQGLKVFAGEDIDISRWHNTSMKGLKRTVRRYGKVLGHRKGIDGDELLDYGRARREIYLPCYRWVLAHRLHKELEVLLKVLERGPLVLLDYETNAAVDDLAKPLSHAALIRQWLLDRGVDCVSPPVMGAGDR